MATINLTSATATCDLVRRQPRWHTTVKLHRRGEDAGNVPWPAIHKHTTASDGTISMRSSSEGGRTKPDTPWGLDGSFSRPARWKTATATAPSSKTDIGRRPAYPLHRRQGPADQLGELRRERDEKGDVVGHEPEPEHVALGIDPGVSSTRLSNT